MFDNSMRYHIFKDYNIPFDEKGTTYGTVRKVQWVKEDNEPDEDKAKIEIRKVYTSGAEEKVGKGYTFSTHEGPGELVSGLIEAGFGETKNILKSVRKREDFADAVANINNDEDDNSDGDMFDMRDLLLAGIDNEEDEDD